MGKPEWGIKRICLNCETKFYDLMKAEIVCPDCGAVFDPEVATRLKRNRQQLPDDLPQKAEVDVAAILDDDLDTDIDTVDDEGVLEDTSDIDDDDDVPIVSISKDKDLE